MFDLKGKVAVVTGASRGMGKTHAILLAKQGVKVAVTDLQQEDCQMVVDEIKNDGGEAIAISMDVSDASAINKTFDEIVSAFGRVDILVNNAGIYKPKMAHELTEDEWDTMIDINLKGQFLCAKRSAKEMAKNKWGRIINIASVASGQIGIGVAGGSHYTASKGGVLGLTEALAVEWAEYGITVNAIGPGAINTPMVDESQMTEEQKNGMIAQIPLKRMGKPEEVSIAVVFLASEEASYITGATLFIDGGWLAT